MSAYAAFELLWPEINRGANLAMGVFNKRSVATLTRLGEHPDQMCNAVSGWASTPGAAIVDLAFRWIVLCKESWVTANHVPLVSKVGQQ